MSKSDKTKDLLEQILSQLYAEQATSRTEKGKSHLIAQDGQLLGKITSNNYDNDSILNEYGPYGSPYSNTSIFNNYSPYGSEYGSQSINNPYCSNPPKLIIDGRLIGYVSVNQYVQNRIHPKAFIYTLKNHIQDLLNGNIFESENEVRQSNRESFIVAEDGTFLGKLNPNNFDNDSIFNRFGPYGNKFSEFSIFNKFSNYGSQFSEFSPYNKFSTTPPKIFKKGQFIAYLTINNFLNPRLHPDELLNWARENVSKYG